jgi:hypothetical protein
MTLLTNNFPRMVVGLQGAFCGHLAADLGTSPLVHPAYAEGVSELLSQEAPVRQVADALLFAVNRSWADRVAADHGSTSISVQSFKSSRLFRPIADKVWEEEPRYGQKADEKALEEALAGRHEQAREVLEIRCRSDFFDIHSLFMVHQNLLPYGLHLYGLRGGFTIVRIPSFTFIESALKYCLGDQALAPCYVEGEVTPTTMNQLHLEGYHPIGMPLKKVRMHNRFAPPAEYPWHDQFHRIEASAHLPVWKQRAASVLFEVLHAVRRTLVVGWVASQEEVEKLLDLEIFKHEDKPDVDLDHIVRRILYNIRQAHGEGAVEKTIRQYLNALKGMKGHRKLAQDAGFAAFKLRVENMNVSLRPSDD